MSASLIVNSINDLSNVKELDRYDDQVCSALKKKLDESLKENDLSLGDRIDFGRKNLLVMNKWSQIFPKGISQCLEEYFQAKALWTPKFDPRFPNQNQAKNCYINFVDYQRCIKLKGADCKDCDYFKAVSTAICPNAWLEKWNEQLENGTFAGKV